MANYIGVIGESGIDSHTARLAYQVGEEVARSGAVLVCGGLSGVMQAAAQGARAHGGTTVGILPGTRREEANPFISVAIVTGMGEARNAVVVRSSDAVIAVGGAYGTLSEIAFCLKLGVPVVGLSTWKLSHDGRPLEDPIVRASDPADAVRRALQAIDRGALR
ncbi:MAG: TIGR00725 family protein [Armatimonadetes bacterium]|nr:TIGR00725 family protein [Armatimonadota bacterium]